MKTLTKLNGYYNYTVILTYIGMLIGFSGISFILEGQCHSAVIGLMLAGICDMFDGAIAATKERTTSEKRFGIQIDSLSDLICFGVLPALLTYHICQKTYMAFAAACLYVLCALIRLAYFNVTEEERQSQESGCRSVYKGLPVTVSALVFPMLFVICHMFPQTKNVLMLAATTAMAIAFVLPFKLKKPHWAGKIAIVIAGIFEFSLLILNAGLNA